MRENQDLDNYILKEDTEGNGNTDDSDITDSINDISFNIDGLIIVVLITLGILILINHLKLRKACV